MARAAMIAERSHVRGADAIHLAAVNPLTRLFADLDERIVLLTSDHEIIQAAIQLEISTEDPAAALRE